MDKIILICKELTIFLCDNQDLIDLVITFDTDAGENRIMKW